MKNFVVSLLQKEGKCVGYLAIQLDDKYSDAKLKKFELPKDINILKATPFVNATCNTKGVLTGVNGNINRYSVYDIDSNQVSNESYVILCRTKNGSKKGFAIANYKGEVKFVSEEEAVKLIKDKKEQPDKKESNKATAQSKYMNSFVFTEYIKQATKNKVSKKLLENIETIGRRKSSWGKTYKDKGLKKLGFYFVVNKGGEFSLVSMSGAFTTTVASGIANGKVVDNHISAIEGDYDFVETVGALGKKEENLTDVTIDEFDLSEDHETEELIQAINTYPENKLIGKITKKRIAEFMLEFKPENLDSLVEKKKWKECIESCVNAYQPYQKVFNHSEINFDQLKEKLKQVNKQSKEYKDFKDLCLKYAAEHQKIENIRF